MYITSNIEKFLNDLAAKLPAPGGGSAAALTAAQGAALLEMVCNFTIDNPKYEKNKIKIESILSRAKDLRMKLEALIDADINAYQNVSTAFKLPKTDPRRVAEVELSLKQAAEVPASVCRYCLILSGLSEELLPVGNSNLISDIGVAIELITAAYNAALLNVSINLSGIKDKDFIKELKDEIYPQQNILIKLKDKIYNAVRGQIEK